MGGGWVGGGWGVGGVGGGGGGGGGGGRCYLCVDSNPWLGLCLAGHVNVKRGIYDWNVANRHKDKSRGDSTNFSCDCLHLVRQWFESIWQQRGLHSCIRTSKVIEWYITIGSHWSLKMLGLITSTAASNSSDYSWNSLRISRQYLDLACSYSYCRPWLSLVWLNTCSLTKA